MRARSKVSEWAIIVGSLLVAGNAARAAPPAEVARGRAVFLTHCQVCHPNGNQGTGPSLKLKAMSSFQLKTQIRMGKNLMPAFPKQKLPKEDLAALSAYLQTLLPKR